ncbi:hypothetical protein HPP92_026274 [Vanilla planifolia]|uniref:Uncharacterized protein n=1 Tax=Vanilla planifolia TaxID=51239 RepID=A0A835PJD3_VANPL|nr:hypothetical protein HPP92_026274 [Vanilla planifolia]
MQELAELKSALSESKPEMDPDRLLENERLQMQQIMELDMEELQVEEVDESSSSSDDDDFLARDSEVQGENGFTFDTCLASMHTYLGEVDDTHGKLAFLDGGAILNLPMFYLRGRSAQLLTRLHNKSWL